MESVVHTPCTFVHAGVWLLVHTCRRLKNASRHRLFPRQVLSRSSLFCRESRPLFCKNSGLFSKRPHRFPPRTVGEEHHHKMCRSEGKSVIFVDLCVKNARVSKKKTTFAVELSLNLLSTPPCKKDYFFSSWRCSLLWRRSRRRRSPSSVAGATSRGISSSLSTAAMSLRRVPTHRM